MTSIGFEIFGGHVLEPHEVWPDGDMPENPTADDVLAVFKRDGGGWRALRDWELSVEIKIYVETPNPNYNGDNVLFGDPPPRTLRTTASTTT